MMPDNASTAIFHQSCSIGLLNLATAEIYVDELVAASMSVWDKVLAPRQHRAGVQSVRVLCSVRRPSWPSRACLVSTDTLKISFVCSSVPWLVMKSFHLICRTRLCVFTWNACKRFLSVFCSVPTFLMCMKELTGARKYRDFVFRLSFLWIQISPVQYAYCTRTGWVRNVGLRSQWIGWSSANYSAYSRCLLLL